MVARQELESDGWIYMCCESPVEPENSQRLDDMGVLQDNRKYVQAHELGGMSFDEAMRKSLMTGNYRAVFYRK